MSIASLYSHRVASVSASDPVSTAVRLMCEQGVGSVFVTMSPSERPVPVGVLTDRDVVRIQVHSARDLSEIRVADVMTRDPVVVNESEDVDTVIGRLAAAGVRRAPVIDASGALVGAISFDDLLVHLATELNALARVTAHQAQR